MSYNFRMFFSGLCAFVPAQPFDTLKPGQATVLLRELSSGLPLPDGESVPPHFAVVSFDTRNRRASSTRQSDARTVGLCIMNQEDLEILPGGTPVATPDLAAFNPTPGDLLNPTPPASRSLFYLVKLAQVLGHSVQALPGLLQPQPNPPAPNPPLLAARVHLTTGTLSTSKLQEGTWVFLPPGSNGSGTGNGNGAGKGTGQRLAEALLLEIGPLSQDVTLQFTPFGGGTPLTLVLGPDAGGGDVEVTVMNGELPRIAAVLSVPPLPVQDQDFRAYYDLLQPFLPPAVIPHLAPDSALLNHPGGCTPVGI
jgi:hypothetical protein